VQHLSLRYNGITDAVAGVDKSFLKIEKIQYLYSAKIKNPQMRSKYFVNVNNNNNNNNHLTAFVLGQPG